MAIRVMKRDFDEENQRRVVEEIMKARFLAPVVLEVMPFKVGTDRTSLRDRSRMKFLCIHDGEGKRFFPAFTDEKEMEKYNLERGQQVSYLTFADYVQIMTDDQSAGGFVINPYGENLVCERKLVMNWAKHMKGGNPGGQPRIRLGQPKTMPSEMLQAVSEYLKGREDVSAAYLSMMQPEGGETSYLIVVDMDGEENLVYDKIAEAAGQYLKGMSLNIEPFSSELGQAAAKGIEAFYTK